jgi:hypothetical protein
MQVELDNFSVYLGKNREIAILAIAASLRRSWPCCDKIANHAPLHAYLWKDECGRARGRLGSIRVTRSHRRMAGIHSVRPFGCQIAERPVSTHGGPRLRENLQPLLHPKRSSTFNPPGSPGLDSKVGASSLFL